MRETFAGRVRRAAREYSAERSDFTVPMLGERIGTQNYSEHKHIRSVLRDFLKRGEATRIRTGLYRYIGNAPSKPQKQQIMWRFLRLQKVVAIDDLLELGPIGREYAVEWVKNLVALGVARDLGNGCYQLIKDTLEPPLNLKKIDRLRNLRQRQKQAIKAIKDARSALDVIDEAIKQLSYDSLRIEEVSDEGGA